jgi:two-component system sensor histidine kinase/response regulator
MPTALPGSGPRRGNLYSPMDGSDATNLLEEIDALPAGAARNTIRLGVERLQTENARSAAELTRTLQLNALFGGILSHDLRNPLGAILMSATVLSRKIADEDVKRALGRILRAGQRMNQMITQLLDFTRARGEGGLRIERKRADLVPIFDRAIEELSEGAVRPVTFEHVGDTCGRWDAERLAQVASHLVGNAFRHGVAQGPIRIEIGGGDPACVTVSVSNDGAIAAELLPVLFEPFQGGVLLDRRTGLGLGLFLSRELIVAHGGTLEVASAGDPTTFKVALPRDS